MKEKISKDKADYIVMATKQHCRDCTMFRPVTEHCTLVSGIINAGGHCKYFEAKNKLYAQKG